MAGSIPRGWRGAPEMSKNLIADKFAASKTPISNIRFGGNDDVEDLVENLQNMAIAKDEPRPITAWINLNKTDRYFDPEKANSCGIDYHHIKLMGGPKAIPPSHFVRQFINICKDSGDGIVAVSSTYGLNRVGYLICSYLVEIKGWKINDAIKEFAEKSPPGIHRQHLLDDLTDKFDGIRVEAPPKPSYQYKR